MTSNTVTMLKEVLTSDFFNSNSGHESVASKRVSDVNDVGNAMTMERGC